MKKATVSLKDLLEAGAHFGHQSARWNPKMKPYLYTIKDGVHVFDLAKTKEGLEKATEFVRQFVTEGKTIVFVGTKRQAQAIITEEAKKIGVPYVSQRWLGGTLTNWEQIKKSIDQLAEMKEKREQGEYKKYTKKEQLLLDRKINKLEKFFGGLASLAKLPEALFVVDVRKEELAVKEAKKKGLIVVGLVDSNVDPDLVDYIIPGNDDAVGNIKLVVSAMAEAVKEGQGIRRLAEKKDEKKS
ncbi:MAG TPA: 30S ribosomal protein S2 [Nevskiaceae bacterium]|nr:30S ribosomal protein S2 [Nevskiaceae bacterium]